MALMAIVSPAGAATATGTVNVAVARATHYQFHAYAELLYGGYGAVLATFGTQPAPTAWPRRTGIGTGTVDFGTTIAGDTYLYKYAAHLHVTTNDPSGFFVYGEAAAVMTNNTTAVPIRGQVLYYLPSGAIVGFEHRFYAGLAILRRRAAWSRVAATRSAHHRRSRTGALSESGSAERHGEQRFLLRLSV